MEENKNIVLAINSILNKKIFYSNRDSLVQKSLNQFHELFDNSTTTKLLDFLEEQKESELLLNLDLIEKLSESINFKNKKINILINLKEEEMLTEYKEIKPLEHVLPFKLVSSLMIDKQFFKEVNIDNHFEVRNKLLPITQFIQEMNNSGLLINNVNFEFNYTDNNENSGFCNKNKIYVQCNKLDSSSLRHEYFHAMDINVAKKLKVEISINKITFSEFNQPNVKLKEFNSFIDNLDKNNSTEEETKENVEIYFKRYLPGLNKNLSEIKEKDIDKEINKIVGNIYTDGKGKNKFGNRDELIKEIKEHIDYGLKIGGQPKRTMFSIISEIKDLPTSYNYYSTISEKLARVYQSQYHTNEDNKIFPQGTEKRLVNELNEIIKKEFKNVFEIKESLTINQINNNIFKLREMATKSNSNKLKMP